MPVSAAEVRSEHTRVKRHIYIILYFFKRLRTISLYFFGSMVPAEYRHDIRQVEPKRVQSIFFFCTNGAGQGLSTKKPHPFGYGSSLLFPAARNCFCNLLDHIDILAEIISYEFNRLPLRQFPQNDLCQFCLKSFSASFTVSFVVYTFA